MERQHSARWKHWHSKRSCSTESHACAGQATTWFAQIETGTVSAARTRAFAMLIWWKLAKLRWHRARSYYIIIYIFIYTITPHYACCLDNWLGTNGPWTSSWCDRHNPVTSCHIRGRSQEHGMQGFFLMQKPQAASGLKPTAEQSEHCYGWRTSNLVLSWALFAKPTDHLVTFINFPGQDKMTTVPSRIMTSYDFIEFPECVSGRRHGSYTWLWRCCCSAASSDRLILLYPASFQSITSNKWSKGCDRLRQVYWLILVILYI